MTEFDDIRRAVDRLEQVYRARAAWIESATGVQQQFFSVIRDDEQIPTVTGDAMFTTKSTALFDAHVGRLIAHARATIRATLDHLFEGVE